MSKRRSRLPDAPVAPRQAAAERVVARPDGYYWVADDGRQEFGPFGTVAEALAAANEATLEQAQALRQAEAQLGVDEAALDRDVTEVDERPAGGSPR
jgi:hypothetical protein